MFTDKEIDFYNENGYVIKRILSEKECDEINDYVDKNNLNAYYETIDPNIKFGYKHDESEKSPVNHLIRKNKTIDDIGKKILNEYQFSVIRSYYKNDFIARDIEYHQEYYNNELHPTRDNPYDYIQIFTALDNHTLENACLKIIPNTHKEGILPRVDIINSNLEHKATVQYDYLVKCSKKYGILNCQLKKGEALFFNHLIVHGSQNNNSPYKRRAIVSTIYKKGLKLDDERFKKYQEFRKQFAIDRLNEKINLLKNN